MNIEKEYKKFREQGGWVKSETELEMEKQGYKLFRNFQRGFSHGTTIDIIKEMQGWQQRRTGSAFGPDYERRPEAYDNLMCRLPDGQSFYLKAPDLISPERVIVRSGFSSKDKPYEGDSEAILEHAKRCYEMNEENLQEVYGI